MKNDSNLKLLETKRIIDYIKKNTSQSEDITYRSILFNNSEIYIVYNSATASGDTISDFVIRSIENLAKGSEDENSDKKNKNPKEKWKDYIASNSDKKDDNKVLNMIKEKIAVSSVKSINLKEDDIFYYLFSGFTLIIYNGDILAVETKKNLDRSVSPPIIETNIKGAKDAFNENYMTNIGLIRKRIKTENLVLEEEKVGRRSKTKIGIMYISDIVKGDLVKQIKRRLEAIDIDAIIDTNYIIELLEENKHCEFPTMISTEKPDYAAYYLLQGRIAIIVENTPFVIVVPAFFQDFIDNVTDEYQKSSNVIITRIVRYISVIITLFTPAVYISLITFDQQSIPTELLLSFASQRDGVPFTAFFEAILMILSFEILRESNYRVPNTAGNTLSIVGALILGDAAVNAGIVSPIMIIVIAITMISGLMFSELNMANAFRSWRILLLVLASIAGLYGIAIGAMFLIIRLCSISSLGKPYTYPISPIDITQLKKNSVLRVNISDNKKRQKILSDNLTKLRIKE